MPQTKRGIYHNLKESKYTVSNGDTVFFFSSKLYLEKFLLGYKMNREKFAKKYSLFTSLLNVEIFADVMFYKTIEKRGFRAWFKGVDITCGEMLQFAYRKVIEKNTNEWSEIQKPRLGE